MYIIYSKSFSSIDIFGNLVLKVNKQLILEDGKFAEILVDSKINKILVYKKLSSFNAFQNSLEGFTIFDKFMCDKCNKKMKKHRTPFKFGLNVLKIKYMVKFYLSKFKIKLHILKLGIKRVWKKIKKPNETDLQTGFDHLEEEDTVMLLDVPINYSIRRENLRVGQGGVISMNNQGDILWEPTLEQIKKTDWYKNMQTSPGA